MRPQVPADQTQSGLFTAVKRFWWVILGSGVVALVLGGAYAIVRPQDLIFGADVTIVIQDPATTLAGGGITARYVTNQAEFLRSEIVADAAARLLEGQDPPVLVDASSLISASSVFFSGESAILTLSIIDPDPVLAVAKVNALADAYREVSRLQVTSFSNNALARIDAQLEAFDERQAELTVEIRTARDEDTALATLERQFIEALTMIGQLQAELAVTTSDTRRAEIRLEIEDLRTRIDVFRQASEAQGPSATLLALLEEQDLIINRRAELIQQRDQIAIEADLAPGAVVSILHANEAVPFPTLGANRILAVTLLLGLAAGTVIAYLLSTRLRSLRARSEPEAILAAPLLADIPDFQAEGVDSTLPVRDAPRSAAAEAFRFAAASLEMLMRSHQAKVVMMVSATLGHGKSTSAINTALASARQGHEVLVIDCDFGNQDSSKLLRGELGKPVPGFTDVVEAGHPLGSAIQTIPLGKDVSISLLGRGRLPTVAADTLRSPGAVDLFRDVKATYDLVFVDAPPLLQVAYASTLAGYVDALVVVVGHGTSARELEELTIRLNLIGTPLLGYIYNKSPLRREMTATEGSMMDILGQGPSPETPAGKRPTAQRR